MKQTKNHYSKLFKQQVLDDYFQTGIDRGGQERKANINLFWNIHFVRYSLQNNQKKKKNET